MSSGLRPPQGATAQTMLRQYNRAAAARPRRMNAREQDIQRAVFDHLRWRGVPGVFAFHVPNGGKRNRVEAAIFKGLGTRDGVPDMLAVYDSRCYAMELKTER